jgi:hypothetical protein
MIDKTFTVKVKASKSTDRGTWAVLGAMPLEFAILLAQLPGKQEFVTLLDKEGNDLKTAPEKGSSIEVVNVAVRPWNRKIVSEDGTTSYDPTPCHTLELSVA